MLLLVLSISSPGLAQSPQNSWENLKGLRPGQRIQVIKMDLSSISDREHPRRGRNAIIGAAIVGGIVAVPAGVLWAICSNEARGCAAGAVSAIAAGAGAGAGLGALSPSFPTIYRAKRVRRPTKP